MTKPDPGWGSCPVAGRDWGGSEGCSPEIIEELGRRFEQSGLDAGIVDDAATPAGSRNPSDSSNLFECLELEAATEHDSSSSSIDATPEDEQFDAFYDHIAQAKQDRRRQTSFAKRSRMSLVASVVNRKGSVLRSRKSLFDRPSSVNFLGTEFALPEKLQATPEFAPYNDCPTDDPVCSRRTALSNSRVLENIFSFLQETELLCIVSLVSTHWADSATQAHASMMLMSVGCSGESDDDDESVTEEAIQVDSFVEREWGSLVSNYPWACFLSEGAFKRVYKVFNYNHRVEEAISVM